MLSRSHEVPVTPPNTVVVTQCLLGETGIGRKKCGTGWGETRRVRGGDFGIISTQISGAWWHRSAGDNRKAQEGCQEPGHLRSRLKRCSSGEIAERQVQRPGRTVTMQSPLRAGWWCGLSCAPSPPIPYVEALPPTPQCDCSSRWGL